ncbi:MAG: hypothetical protein AAF191_03940, partial [Verrucomicrobiota bacterium]
QTVDLVVKLVSELLAFVKLNGIPGDGIGDFAKALGEYGKESKIRMAALIAFDGLVPLGPDFLNKASDSVKTLTEDGLRKSPVFSRIVGFLPDGMSPTGFVRKAFEASAGRLESLTAEGGLNRDAVVDKLRDFVELSDDKLDYLGAFLDMTTNYYEHTGLQTVATKVIEQAVNEV